MDQPGFDPGLWLQAKQRGEATVDKPTKTVKDTVASPYRQAEDWPGLLNNVRAVSVNQVTNRRIPSNLVTLLNHETHTLKPRNPLK